MRSYILPALAVSLLAVATTAAQAADLPTRRAPPVYFPPPIPVFTWTGFFVGANAGASFDSARNNSYAFPAGSIAGSTGTSGILSSTGARNTVGFTGGGQIGYNYELGGAGFGGFGFGGGGLVIGGVADAQYRDSRNNGNASVFTAFTPGNAFVNVPGLPRTNIVTNGQGNNNFFGTVRARLGIAFDRAMIYGTGGFAYDTRTTGYTYGGGIEYSITNNVSVGAEYLRVNLNRGLGTASATYLPPAGLGAGTLLVTTRGWRQ